MFSPEGHSYQVAHAMEATGNVGTCRGISANGGVLLAAERHNTHKLLDEDFFFLKNFINSVRTWLVGWQA